MKDRLLRGFGFLGAVVCGYFAFRTAVKGVSVGPSATVVAGVIDIDTIALAAAAIALLICSRFWPRPKKGI